MDDASEFDVATAVRPRADGRTYDATIDAGFAVGPIPNGGYLLALAGRAAGEGLGAVGIDHRDALAATAHYLRAPVPGPATVVVEVARPGRRASQVRATIEQGDRRCVDVTFTMGTLGNGRGPTTWSAASPPEIAPYDDCHRLPSHPEGGAIVIAMNERNDLRLDPASLGFATGAQRGLGDLRGWISLADGRPADPLALLFFVDALPPASFDIAPSGPAPTLSLTAYVRARPRPGPLRIRQRATVVDGGLFDEVCEIWDSSDRLVAQATQLAMVTFTDAESVVPFPG